MAAAKLVLEYEITLISWFVGTTDTGWEIAPGVIQMDDIMDRVIRILTVRLPSMVALEGLGLIYFSRPERQTLQNIGNASTATVPVLLIFIVYYTHVDKTPAS